MSGKPEKSEPFTAWITKYALTVGVFVRSVTTCEERSMVDVSKMVRDAVAEYPTYYHQPDWHRTEAEAVARVRVMVAAKRKALTKQAAKLDALEKDPLGKGGGE